METSQEAEATYNEIQEEIKETGKLDMIGIICYICQKEGHVSVDCPDFHSIEGNIKIRGSNNPLAKDPEAISKKLIEEQKANVTQHDFEDGEEAKKREVSSSSSSSMFEGASQEDMRRSKESIPLGPFNKRQMSKKKSSTS
jgi:hypothetical protein